MICYKDNTFCPFDRCLNFRKCLRALHPIIVTDAEKFGLPISRFAEEPDCYVDKGTKIKKEKK